MTWQEFYCFLFKILISRQLVRHFITIVCQGWKSQPSTWDGSRVGKYLSSKVVCLHQKKGLQKTVRQAESTFSWVHAWLRKVVLYHSVDNFMFCAIFYSFVVCKNLKQIETNGSISKQCSNCGATNLIMVALKFSYMETVFWSV